MHDDSFGKLIKPETGRIAESSIPKVAHMPQIDDSRPSRGRRRGRTQRSQL